MDRTPARIDVWRDYHGGADWSVSLCNSDGDEITCFGGEDLLSEAWDWATELADEYHVPAFAIYDSGEVRDGYEYRPEKRE